MRRSAGNSVHYAASERTLLKGASYMNRVAETGIAGADMTSAVLFWVALLIASGKGLLLQARGACCGV